MRSFFFYKTISHYQSSFTRSHREAPNSIEVRFSYKGEKFSLALSTPAPILHPSADIVSLSDRSSVRWTDAHPNCFLTGTVTSHPGIASFSVCDQVVSDIIIMLLKDSI